MKFEEFVEYVKQNIRDYLPEELKDASVEIQLITKNNGVIFHAVIIRASGTNIAPTIYLEDFYANYEGGRKLETIMKTLASIAADNQHFEVCSTMGLDYTNFDSVKDKIVMILVNAKKNAEMLLSTPYTQIEDLAIIYKVLLDMGKGEMATVTIRQEHLKLWEGVTVEMIHDCAMRNSNRLLPVCVKPIDEVMKEIMHDALQDDMFQEMLECMLHVPMDRKLFVISNSSRINGAAAIFYSDVLEKLAAEIGTDLYVLPSSIHETLVASTNVDDAQILSSMVSEINEEKVSLEEQLSDNVYLYCAAENRLTLAE